jgi:hypothetical protein
MFRSPRDHLQGTNQSKVPKTKLSTLAHIIHNVKESVVKIQTIPCSIFSFCSCSSSSMALRFFKFDLSLPPCSIVVPRYQKHVRYIRKDAPQSAYAVYILHNAHEYGRINNSMSVLKQVNKGPSMNSFEQFYIQIYSYNNKRVPEQCTGEHNPIA